MADDVRKLLDHIVRTFVVRDEMINIDLDASATDGATIASDKRRALRREEARADELADDFGRGLAQATDGIVVLDDRNPDENRIADALIYFLVSHGLAQSRTVGTDPGHYRYRILIDWARLEAAAKDAGVDLPLLIRRLRDKQQPAGGPR